MLNLNFENDEPEPRARPLLVIVLIICGMLFIGSCRATAPTPAPVPPTPTAVAKIPQPAVILPETPWLTIASQCTTKPCWTLRLARFGIPDVNDIDFHFGLLRPLANGSLIPAAAEVLTVTWPDGGKALMFTDGMGVTWFTPGGNSSFDPNSTIVEHRAGPYCAYPGTDPTHAQKLCGLGLKLNAHIAHVAQWVLEY
jgi:hypothetical protein